MLRFQTVTKTIQNVHSIDIVEPNQPEWPINVMIFEPSDDIQAIKDKIKYTEDPPKTFDEQWYAPYPFNELDDDGKPKNTKDKYQLSNTGKEVTTHTSRNHFSTKHWALLFKPGEYKNCDFEVGYYVQMAGLGKTAKGEGSVRFTGEQSGPFVPALNKDMPTPENGQPSFLVRAGSITELNAGLCLDTFWRSAENFSAEKVMWAVSQAAPVRRVHVKTELTFGDGAAYSSGGFVANAEVEGNTTYAANQQWFSRGVKFGSKVEGGAW